MNLVWHRGDLRTHDHPALNAAAARGAVLGLVILDPAILGRTSARRQAWFLANVRALRECYRELGSELLVRTAAPVDVLSELAAGVFDVHALRSHTPYGRERDAVVSAALGARVQWHDGLYVREPGTLRTRTGTPYTVYGPFSRAWREAGAPDPLDAPASLVSAPLPAGGAGEIPSVESDVPLPAPGEVAALGALRGFLEHGMGAYAEQRDRLDGAGSSRLSYYITIGVLSARTAASAAWERRGAGAQKWLAELAWRDFLADVLYARPELLEEPYHERWKQFRWRRSARLLEAWREGRTGVPAVDAAMRELRATGWISNRARMLAAQFLAKHLRVSWRHGERVFRDWLLDGDTASNVGNWQWAAGLGIDNAPYFRVFNPVTQARQHDPDGAWLRRWVPESDGDPRPLPHAIVELGAARREYLAAAEEVR